MEDNNENVLTFGDKSYSPDDLSDQQKYFANQIQALQSQRKNQQFAIDQLTAALEFFTGQLIASLQQEDEQEDSSAVG
jgi:hypothetical protein